MKSIKYMYRLTPDDGEKNLPGEQDSNYEDATPENVKQEIKELNNNGPHGNGAGQP